METPMTTEKFNILVLSDQGQGHCRPSEVPHSPKYSCGVI